MGKPLTKFTLATMELKISFAIFCLILESILAQNNYVQTGVRRFEMYVGDDNFCGGNQVKIKLRDSRGNTCETKASKSFRKNAVVTWSAYRTGTCRTNMIIDDSTKVQVVTESTGYSGFCPRKIIMYTQDREKFESRMLQSFYGRDTNQRNHDVSRSGNSVIKKITLKIKNGNCGWNDDCGGRNIKIRVKTGNEHCYVEEKPIIWKNHFAIWSGDQLKDCEGMNVDSAYSTVSVETRQPQDKFGIHVIQILMSDNVDTLYEVLGVEYAQLPVFLSSGENRRFQVNKIWPPPGGVPERPRTLVCPREDEDACPTHEMFAYNVVLREHMNCAFECDRVTRTPYSTNLDETDGTGFRCVQTQYMSSQFGYCCKTRTNGAIPYCPDVVNGSSHVQTQEQFEEETDLQCPDLGVGCPIESVEQYFDSPSMQVPYDCQPECDFVNGPVHPDTTKSGFFCTQLQRNKRETKFCCNAQGVTTTLPTCQSRNAIRQRVDNQVSNQELARSSVDPYQRNRVEDQVGSQARSSGGYNQNYQGSRSG